MRVSPLAKAAFIESGTWITYVSKLSHLEKPIIECPNLKNMEVEDYTCANDLGPDRRYR